MLKKIFLKILKKILPKSIVCKINNFIASKNLKKYNKTREMFKKYTCKWRVQINNKIEKHFKGENYFLAFGVLLKYYRDNNFFDEDLDYVVDGNAVNVLKNLNKVKGFKLISEGWCENFPIIMKFKYRNKTIIDFFFLNNINGNLYVCCRKPYLSGELQNIPKDKKEYNKCETFIVELFPYEDFGTSLYEYEGSKYRFPNNIPNYLFNFYGPNWTRPLNYMDSYKECAKICKNYDIPGKYYSKDAFA